MHVLIEATSKQSRVNQMIAYLVDKENAAGERGLGLFLRVLQAQMPVEDGRHGALAKLATAVEAGEGVVPTAWVEAVRRAERPSETHMGSGVVVEPGATVQAGTIAGRDAITHHHHYASEARPEQETYTPPPLPPGSHLPHEWNVMFTGREAELKELARLLFMRWMWWWGKRPFATVSARIGPGSRRG